MTNPIRYTCFTLLIRALLGSLTMQAQSATAVTKSSQPANPLTTESTTQKTKATESAFYLKAYGLYGLLTTNPQIEHIDSYNTNLSSSPTAYQTYTTKLGLGPRAGIGVGVVVSDFINLGLDADILLSQTPVSNVASTYTVSISSTQTQAQAISSMLKLLSISPNITFKALSRPAYYIYNRLGVMGGMVLSYQTNIHANYTGLGAPMAGEILTDYTKNSLSLGYQAALGIQFRLTQKLRGFAEVVLYNQTFKPQEFQTTQTGFKTTTTLLTNEGSYYRSTNQPAGSPSYQPNFKVAVTSLSAGIGLVYRP